MVWIYSLGGFVEWKELLNDLAREINLDVEKESDLVEVAQYYVNEKNSRNEINEKILNRFITESQESENIRTSYTDFLDNKL